MQGQSNRRAVLKALAAGVGRVDITPPVGIRMMGYTLQECVSDSIDSELTATALVLACGETKVVLIACDILFIQSPRANPKTPFPPNSSHPPPPLRKVRHHKPMA